MPLTNAEKQRRWRDKRNELAQALTGTPKQVAEAILAHLGPRDARRVLRALDKRLSAIKPDCEGCGGTGFMPVIFSTPCGMPIGPGRHPCDCGELAAAIVAAKQLRNQRTPCELNERAANEGAA